MQSISDRDDDVNLTCLGHIVHANGDATVDFLDEATGRVITETIVGYMWPMSYRPEAGGPAEAAVRELPDPRVTDLDGDDLPW
jgi:hypothetical protein